MAKHGKLIIFNMENFQNNPNMTLTGNNVDVQILQDTFQKFSADTSTVHTNLTKEQVQNVMDKVKEEDFSAISYLAVAVLTHGDRKDALYSNNGLFDLDDEVIFPILHNKSLFNKPKLFIIDACKGKYDMAELTIDYSASRLYAFSPQKTVKCFATSEGFKAFQTREGSFFIREFCKLLKSSGDEKSVECIMKKTINLVAEKTQNRQLPSLSTNFGPEDTDQFILGKM